MQGPFNIAAVAGRIRRAPRAKASVRLVDLILLYASVTLASFPVGLATVPGSIQIPAGSAAATFVVKTSNVRGNAQVRIVGMCGNVAKRVQCFVVLVRYAGTASRAEK